MRLSPVITVLACFVHISAPAQKADTLKVTFPDSVLHRASDFFMQGEYQSAIDLLEAEDSALFTPGANFYLGSSYAALNDMQNAVRCLRRAVRDSSSCTGYRFMLAKTLAASGDAEEALEEYERIMAADPGFAPAPFQAGVLRYERRDYEASIDAFRRAVSLSPRDFLSLYYIGSSLLSLGKGDSAVRFLAASLTLNDRFGPTIDNLASIYFKQSNYLEALRLYEKLGKLNEKNADAWYKQALCLEKLEKYRDAANRYRAAVSLDTANSSYLARLGQTLYQVGSYDSSAMAYHRAALLEAENSTLFMNEGLAWAKADSLDRGITALKRAIEVFHVGRAGLIYTQLGSLYYNQKRYRDAQKCYRKGLEYNPGDAEAQFYYSLSCEQLGEYKSAASGYRNFLKLAAGDSTQAEKQALARTRLRKLDADKK